jgi:hypothetical protein
MIVTLMRGRLSLNDGDSNLEQCSASRLCARGPLGMTSAGERPHPGDLKSGTVGQLGAAAHLAAERDTNWLI